MNFSLRAALLLAVMLRVFHTSTVAAFNGENPRIQLVSEFVRELEVLYRLQETNKNWPRIVRHQAS